MVLRKSVNTQYNVLFTFSPLGDSVVRTYIKVKWFTTNRHLFKPRDNVRYVPEIRNILPSVFSRCDPVVLTNHDATS